MYQIEVAKAGPRRLAGIMHFGPYTAIGESFARLDAIMAQSGIAGPTAKLIAVYLDDPGVVPAHALRSFAGMSVGWKKELPPTLEERRLPGGRVAVLHHHGPYTGLAVAWAHVYNIWLPQARESVVSSPYEVYLNSAAKTAPDALRTDICLPLR